MEKGSRVAKITLLTACVLGAFIVIGYTGLTVYRGHSLSETAASVTKTVKTTTEDSLDYWNKHPLIPVKEAPKM